MALVEHRLPKWIKPQLTRLAEEAPEGKEWLHEIKYDGYRMHARIDGATIQLLTRTGLDWSHRYKRTIEALRSLKVKSAYLDGELCALYADGVPVFNRLQAEMDEGRTDQLVFFAFDLLFLNGQSTAQLPLVERKKDKAATLRRGGHLAVSGSIPPSAQFEESFSSPPEGYDLSGAESTPRIRTLSAPTFAASTLVAGLSRGIMDRSSVLVAVTCRGTSTAHSCFSCTNAGSERHSLGKDADYLEASCDQSVTAVLGCDSRSSELHALLITADTPRSTPVAI
jgi:hypothetical protein